MQGYSKLQQANSFKVCFHDRNDTVEFLDQNSIESDVKKAKFTGNKLTDKVYYRHTGHPGGIKSTTAGKILSGRFPERAIEMAVKRMLPKESWKQTARGIG